MNLKHIAAAALVAVSGSAFAVGPGALGTIDNLPITISNTPLFGNFEDIFSFSLADSGSFSGITGAVNFSGFNIQGLTVTLTDASFAVIGSDSNPSDGFTFGGLTAGSYALSVLGFADGSSGGFYAGGFIAETAPVPEPETYALMLAGLGMVIFMAARRRQS